jgi:MFS transporter, DHA1 family, inner membrane transport protein
MPTQDTSPLTARHVAAALAIGTIAVLMVGLQPILLGELVQARQVTLEGVGLVAMGEIVALGLGVVLGDALLPWDRLRWITIAAALSAAAMDGLTLQASGDGPMLAVRAAAGLAEGVLVWGATGVIVRTADPPRIGGIFFVVQTIAQAALGAVLANLVIPQGGWQAGFATLAVVGLVAVLLAFVQPARLAPLPAPAVSGFRWSATTLLPLAVAFLQLAALGSFWAYLEPIGQAAGLDSRSAQTLISGVLAMQVLGGTVAAAVVRRWPAVAALMGSSIAIAVLVVTVHELAPGQVLPFALACAGFGFVWLFMFPFQIRLAFRADTSGRLAMLVPASQLIGSAFGPLVASFVVEGDNASAVPLLSAGFALGSAVVVLAARQRRAPALA